MDDYLLRDIGVGRGQALAELVTLCGASPWISEQMARNPVLLDELLDRASLYTAPDKALLQQ